MMHDLLGIHGQRGWVTNNMSNRDLFVIFNEMHVQMVERHRLEVSDAYIFRVLTSHRAVR